MNLIKINTNKPVKVDDVLDTSTGLAVKVLRIDTKRNKVLASICCNGLLMSYHPSELRCAWTSLEPKKCVHGVSMYECCAACDNLGYGPEQAMGRA